MRDDFGALTDFFEGILNRFAIDENQVLFMRLLAGSMDGSFNSCRIQ
jgi:hypothetical protein